MISEENRRSKIGEVVRLQEQTARHVDLCSKEAAKNVESCSKELHKYVLWVTQTGKKEEEDDLVLPSLEARIDLKLAPSGTDMTLVQSPIIDRVMMKFNGEQKRKIAEDKGLRVSAHLGAEVGASGVEGKQRRFC